MEKSKKIRKWKGGIEVKDPSKEKKEPVRGSLEKSFQPAVKMGAQERELEKFIREKLGTGQIEKPTESTYMKLVSEEKELYKIPKIIDTGRTSDVIKGRQQIISKKDEEHQSLE